MKGVYRSRLAIFKKNPGKFPEFFWFFFGWTDLGSAVSARTTWRKLNEGALNPRRHALAAKRDEQRRAQVTCDWRPPDGPRGSEAPTLMLRVSLTPQRGCNAFGAIFQISQHQKSPAKGATS